MAYSAEFPFLLLVLHVSGRNNDDTSYAAPASVHCSKEANGWASYGDPETLRQPQ